MINPFPKNFTSLIFLSLVISCSPHFDNQVFSLQLDTASLQEDRERERESGEEEGSGTWQVSEVFFDSINTPMAAPLRQRPSYGVKQIDRSQKLVYTAKEDTTLMLIAYHLYQDVSLWKELKKLNPQLTIRKNSKVYYHPLISPLKLTDQYSHHYQDETKLVASATSKNTGVGTEGEVETISFSLNARSSAQMENGQDPSLTGTETNPENGEFLNPPPGLDGSLQPSDPSRESNPLVVSESPSIQSDNNDDIDGVITQNINQMTDAGDDSIRTMGEDEQTINSPTADSNLTVQIPLENQGIEFKKTSSYFMGKVKTPPKDFTQATITLGGGLGNSFYGLTQTGDLGDSNGLGRTNAYQVYSRLDYKEYDFYFDYFFNDFEVAYDSTDEAKTKNKRIHRYVITGGKNNYQGGVSYTKFPLSRSLTPNNIQFTDVTVLSLVGGVRLIYPDFKLLNKIFHVNVDGLLEYPFSISSSMLPLRVKSVSGYGGSIQGGIKRSIFQNKNFLFSLGLQSHLRFSSLSYQVDWSTVSGQSSTSNLEFATFIFSDFMF